jgi:hypothetical protein
VRRDAHARPAFWNAPHTTHCAPTVRPTSAASSASTARPASAASIRRRVASPARPPARRRSCRGPRHRLDDPGRQPVGVGGAREVRELEHEDAGARGLLPLGDAQPGVGPRRLAGVGGRALERLGEGAGRREPVVGVLGERPDDRGLGAGGQGAAGGAQRRRRLARCWRMIAYAFAPAKGAWPAIAS